MKIQNLTKMILKNLAIFVLVVLHRFITPITLVRTDDGVTHFEINYWSFLSIQEIALIVIISFLNEILDSLMALIQKFPTFKRWMYKNHTTSINKMNQSSYKFMNHEEVKQEKCVNCSISSSSRQRLDSSDNQCSFKSAHRESRSNSMHFTDKEIGCNLDVDTREFCRRGSIQTNRIKAQIDHLNIALIDTINQINNQDLKLSSSDYRAFISHVQSFAQNLRNNKKH